MLSGPPSFQNTDRSPHGSAESRAPGRLTEPGHRKAARGKTRVRMTLSPPAGAAAGDQAADRCVGLDPRGPDPPPPGPLPPARRAAHVQLPGPGGRHQPHTRPPPALTLQGPLCPTTEGGSFSRERAGDRGSFAALAAGGVTRASAHRPRAGRSRELEPRPRARRVTGRAERAVGGPARRRGVRAGRGGFRCAGAAVFPGCGGLVVPFRPGSAGVVRHPSLGLFGFQRPGAALAGQIRLPSQL